MAQSPEHQEQRADDAEDEHQYRLEVLGFECPQEYVHLFTPSEFEEVRMFAGLGLSALACVCVWVLMVLYSTAVTRADCALVPQV